MVRSGDGLSYRQCTGRCHASSFLYQRCYQTRRVVYSSERHLRYVQWFRLWAEILYNRSDDSADPVSVSSPRASFTGGSNNNEKARLVLDAIISLLRIPTTYMKFAEALPVARIALLWLGSEPSPALVCQVLAIVGISFSTSTSFGKKFELASGWLTFKKVLPPIWNDAIHEAAVDLLLQPARDGGTASKVVKCPQILAVMLLALRQGLLAYSDTRVQGRSPSLSVWRELLTPF